MTLRFLSALILAVATLAGLPAGARAQQKLTLPAEIIEAQQPTPDQLAKVREFCEQGLTSMRSVDPATFPQDVKDGRNHILEAFKNTRMSVRIREEFSTILVPELTKLTNPKGPNLKDNHALNAARLAGYVATPESATLLQNLLKDDRVAVRAAAAMHMGRTFEALAVSAPAMVVDRAVVMTRALGEVVASDKSFDTVDGAVRSLAIAMRDPRPGHALLRDSAMNEVATQAGERIKKFGVQPEHDTLLPAMLRVATSLREALAGQAQFSGTSMRKGAEFAGHSSTYVYRNLPALAQRPAEARVIQEKLLNEAETLLATASAKAGGPAYKPLSLASDVSPVGMRSFIDKFLNTVMPFLHGPPFKFPAGTFIPDEKPAPPPGGN